VAILKHINANGKLLGGVPALASTGPEFKVQYQHKKGKRMGGRCGSSGLSKNIKLHK
jgi:hypothetical protein